MTDAEFLTWVADRLVHVYGERPNTDFVQKLRRIANISSRVEEQHESHHRKPSYQQFLRGVNE